MTAQEISVNIPPTLDPVYSNMIQIAYKDDEFTFMFLHQLPQVNQARAKAIVSITPAHAKNLMGVLTKTIADYEAKFGAISPANSRHREGQHAERVFLSAIVCRSQRLNPLSLPEKMTSDAIAKVL